jgi:hypothetical protein
MLECPIGCRRHLLATATTYDGRSQTDAARIGGPGLQTVRNQ